MMEATLKFFDIKKCGYYINRNTTARFGNLSETLKNVYDWGKSRDQIINSSTYETDLANDLRGTYFYDMAQENNTGDYILTLWNEIHNDGGAVFGIPQNATPGSSKMLRTDFGKTPAIPGFPSYFWFIPKKEIVVSIVFDHSGQAKSNLQNYINGYLANKSLYKVTNSENKVIGYSNTNPPINDHQEIIPKFEAISSKNAEFEAEILSKASSITRLVKKETLDYKILDDRNIIERVFSNLTKATPIFSGSRDILHEIQFTPSKEHIAEIISNYFNRPKDTCLKNVGFVTKTGKRYMLNGINVSLTHKFNLIRKENEIINVKQLLDRILQTRDRILSSVSIG